MKQYVSAFLFLFLLFHSTPASSQTKWFKYEGNPILDVGPKGTWDDDSAIPSRIIFHNLIYQMWYSGLDGTHGRLGYATSRDGIDWKKHRLNPVLDINPESWDNVKAYLVHVLFTGSKYEMWYTGGAGVNVRIGYATSKEGIHWIKSPENPVLDYDKSRPWHEIGLASPSVLGPDVTGISKMWYHGIGPDRIQIGYATRTGIMPWIKHPDPVLGLGRTGEWDDSRVGYPKVLYDGKTYHMWYSGARATNNTFRVGYATSLDGIHWTKSPENPVLRVGPTGSWDDYGVWIGDVMFDNMMYYMWYAGHDESKGRTGLAVSPKGVDVSVSPSNAYVSPGSVIRVTVRVAEPKGLFFSAVIKAPPRGQYFPGLIGQADLQQVADVKLFDDGAHGDSLAGDGLFANTWSPKDENVYLVDVKLKFRQRHDTLRFTMENAGAFTTVGPIHLESVQFVGNPRPNPGDTVLIKLTLRNQGALVTPTEVSASLSAADSFVTDIASVSPVYGEIRAGETATTSGYYRLHISPNCLTDANIKINVSISSLGIALWHDAFTLRVSPPWWRTIWAYALYLVLMVGSLSGTAWYVGNRKLRRRIQRLEQERALERERARISQDMHDEVGATLTEIAILSELAKKKPEEAGGHVQQISERAAEVIDNIGEIVWALNPKNDTLDNVIAHIRRHAVEYLKLTPIKCRFVVPDVLPTYQLSAEIRRNLFLVVKEAIHNIVKHSQASEVAINVMIEKSKLELSIDDNGRGFSIDDRLDSGNGLHNMKKRIEEIGGTFHLDSKPNQGTKVRIVLVLQAHK